MATPIRPVVVPGGGWVVRTTNDAVAIFAVSAVAPTLAWWLWVVAVALRATTLLLLRRARHGPALVVVLDGLVVVAVASAFPDIALALLLPWTATTVAVAVGGDRARMSVTSVTSVVVAVLAVRHGVTTPPAALVAGAVGAGVVAWVLGEQVRVLRDGNSSVLSWLRGRSTRMLDATSEALLMTDAAGAVVQGNAAAAVLAGVEPARLAGSRCDELGLHHGLRALECRDVCPLLALAADGDVEVWQDVGGGQRRHLLARATPVRDRAGRLVEVTHAFRDISGLRRAEEAETLFLAAASHELKTPLTVIRGFTTLLRDTEVPPEQRVEMLDTVIGRAVELNTIVERLLLTGKVGSGRLELTLLPADLGDIVDERAAAITAVSPRHDVQVTRPDHVPFVLGDADSLPTVVDHLLENAVKYSPDGGAVAVRLVADAEHVVLAVTDHGIGMSPADAARCFDRFWQGDVGERRRFGGTGIGLYVVRQLVEGMHGTVEAYSRPGHGTTMVVRLRRADVVAEAARDADEPPRLGMVDTVMTHVGVTR